MSLATLSPAGFDDRDDLARFLEQVPAAADYDRDELGPVRSHRPHRGADKRAAIEQSQREG
ncbi:hypothetical protein Ade02nite_20260 [Paractinoplanes deccanensis]|uniref:Uncharacterized protein n=1 Tax=Paractinoplanes deccanensis TaxID=113561 RepID=A0ABQ3Y091_9ACTN|nr:hypothetical protein [Actinoplanes deccanensis]GID73385.1 hypothetical protein Ade02nite_20260 [Actinoplanes deccanensis]